MPGKQRTYEEVKNEIADRLADERASQEIQTLHEKVENERSAGKSLKEIGESLKLPFREIAEIGSRGQDRRRQAGDRAAPRPPRSRRPRSPAPSASRPEATDLGDGGYAWVDVLGVTPEKQKTFEEVKDEVKAGALEADRRKEVTALAAKLVERLAQGRDHGSARQGDRRQGGEDERPSRATPRRRACPRTPCSRPSRCPRAAPPPRPTADGKARIILRVADVIPAPPPTPEQTDRLKDELARQLQSDVLGEYVAGLQTRYGLSVNDAALKQALGAAGASSRIRVSGRPPARQDRTR